MRMLVFALCLGWAAGQDRVTLTGSITDTAGKPVDHATVLVYHAGLKVGYSTFCPSCYSDCGKRALTDADGRYSVAGLSPDLWFELLVVKDGFRPEMTKAPDAVLKPRAPVDDPSHAVRGRVVNGKGTPQRDAVVTPRGLAYTAPNGKPARLVGAARGIDPIAVTNASGEFEIAYDKPAESMALMVEARGMATRLFQGVPTGKDVHDLTVTELNRLA